MPLSTIDAADEPAATVAAVLAQALSQQGVRKVFGIPGIHNLPLWFELEKAGIDRVLVRHEQAAHYAADGYFRASGELGVCVTTSGPGAANTAGATGEALTSGSAVLHITTSTPLGLRHEDPSVRRGTVHDLPFQAKVFEPLVKSAWTVDRPEDAAAEIASAIADATTGWTGPTYLEVPADLLGAGVPDPVSVAADRTNPVAETLHGVPDEALELITADGRLVIWAGYGACGADVAALADHLGAPVVTTLMGRSTIDSQHPLAVGMAIHEPAVTELVESAQVVLAIGTDFDGQNTQNWRLKLAGDVVRVDIVARQLEVNVTPRVGICLDAALFIEEVLQRAERAPDERRDHARLRVAAVREAVAARLAGDSRDALGSRLVQSLSKAVPDDVAVVADMTLAGYWAAAYLPRAQPRTFMYPMGWGTLGYSLPLSLGVAHATERPVVVLSGDAGILFNLGELATVKDRELPIVVVIFNDKAYGVLAYGMPDDQAAEMRELGTPDFVAVAEAFGITAERATLDTLDTVLSVALGTGRPHLIEVPNVADPPVSIVARWPLKARD